MGDFTWSRLYQYCQKQKGQNMEASVWEIILQFGWLFLLSLVFKLLLCYRNPIPRASKHDKKWLIGTIMAAGKLIVLASIGKKLPLSIAHWILALLKLAKLVYRSLRCLIKSESMNWFGLLTQSNILHNLDPIRRYRVLSNSIDFWAKINHTFLL